MDNISFLNLCLQSIVELFKYYFRVGPFEWAAATWKKIAWLAANSGDDKQPIKEQLLRLSTDLITLTFFKRWENWKDDCFIETTYDNCESIFEFIIKFYNFYI